MNSNTENLRALLGVDFEDEAPAVKVPVKQIKPSEIVEKANVFGCTLNGQPAKIVPGRFARVVSAIDSAIFNWRVAEFVIRKGGNFETRNA